MGLASVERPRSRLFRGGFVWGSMLGTNFSCDKKFCEDQVPLEVDFLSAIFAIPLSMTWICLIHRCHLHLLITVLDPAI